ncbi:membrane protein [Arthrobacter phage Trustiboi]|uniref:Membrane protein n=1 Tax=Arthrobacter phage Trustiboi TaxID=2951391 RepID=A0A9E7NG19_9CAUD|nr:membrane protein [Arthrobacter phage Trustiboi]UTN91646.1 membrane protein [Arthrobacter phage Trustiboi]
MNSELVSQLIAGGTGCVISWALVTAFYIFVQSRGKQDKSKQWRVDPLAFEPRFGSPVSNWYRTWAWKPVHTVDRGYIWLRPYWRRNIQRHAFLDGGPTFWWQNTVELKYLDQ